MIEQNDRKKEQINNKKKVENTIIWAQGYLDCVILISPVPELASLHNEINKIFKLIS